MTSIIERGRNIFSPESAVKTGSIKKHTFTRAKIYKGKVAPTGTVYLKLRVWTEKQVITSCEHIPGNQTKETESIIEKQMIENIKVKYNLA